MRFTGQNKRAINPKYFLNEAVATEEALSKYTQAMDKIQQSTEVRQPELKRQMAAIVYSMFQKELDGQQSANPIDVVNSMIAAQNISKLGGEVQSPLETAQEVGAALFDVRNIASGNTSLEDYKKALASHITQAMTPEDRPQPLTATKPEFAPDVSNRKGVVCRAAYLVQIQAEKALTAGGRTDLLPRVQDYKRFKNKTAIMGTVTLAILNKALEESGEKPFAPTDFAGACRDTARVMKAAPKIATIDVASVIERRGGSAVASAAPQEQPSSALTESKIRDTSYNRLKDEKNKRLFEALIKG